MIDFLLDGLSGVRLSILRVYGIEVPEGSQYVPILRALRETTTPVFWGMCLFASKVFRRAVE